MYLRGDGDRGDFYVYSMRMPAVLVERLDSYCCTFGCRRWEAMERAFESFLAQPGDAGDGGGGGPAQGQPRGPRGRFAGAERTKNSRTFSMPVRKALASRLGAHCQSSGRTLSAAADRALALFLSRQGI